MSSAHWNISADLLAWVRAESKRLGRSTSQVVSSILAAARAQEQLIAAPSVSDYLMFEVQATVCGIGVTLYLSVTDFY